MEDASADFEDVRHGFEVPVSSCPGLKRDVHCYALQPSRSAGVLGNNLQIAEGSSRSVRRRPPRF
jgi:hypothetical protein